MKPVRAQRPTKPTTVLQFAKVKRGLQETPEIRHAVEQFVAVTVEKETIARDIYRRFDQAINHLAGLIGKKAMFRIGDGPVFALRKPKGGFVVNKDVEYLRTGSPSNFNRLSAVTAEANGFAFPENQLPM